jgi:hypothetical protein
MPSPLGNTASPSMMNPAVPVHARGVGDPQQSLGVVAATPRNQPHALASPGQITKN